MLTYAGEAGDGAGGAMLAVIMRGHPSEPSHTDFLSLWEAKYAVYLLYWYKSTSTDAAAQHQLGVSSCCVSRANPAARAGACYVCWRVLARADVCWRVLAYAAGSVC
jgi:hypothetical protein